MDTRRTAVHEAGHATAAYLLGMPLQLEDGCLVIPGGLDTGEGTVLFGRAIAGGHCISDDDLAELRETRQDPRRERFITIVSPGLPDRRQGRWSFLEETVEKLAVMTLSGPYAERLFFGDTDPGTRSDWRELRRLLDAAPSDEERTKLRERYIAEALRLTREPGFYTLCSALSRELEQRNYLDGRQTFEIFVAAEGRRDALNRRLVSMGHAAD
jgi:hypothetical protein